MDYIVLAGGFGTRISSISNGIPKALLPVGNGFYLDLLLKKIIDKHFSLWENQKTEKLKTIKSEKTCFSKRKRR